MLCIKIHKGHIDSSNEKLKKRTKDEMNCNSLVHPAHLLLCVVVRNPSRIPWTKALKLCHPINPSLAATLSPVSNKMDSLPPPRLSDNLSFIKDSYVAMACSSHGWTHHLPSIFPLSPFSYCVSAGAPQTTHWSNCHVTCPMRVNAAKEVLDMYTMVYRIASNYVKGTPQH